MVEVRIAAHLSTICEGRCRLMCIYLGQHVQAMEKIPERLNQMLALPWIDITSRLSNSV
jgi:hypothetical protein